MTEDQFDEALDNATHAVIAEFKLLGAQFPEGTQAHTELLYRINDALTAIMSDAVERT